MKPVSREVVRIAASMTVACAAGAAILGVVYVATDRYREASALRTEREAVATMLGIDSTTTVVEVRQYLEPARREVIYRAAPFGVPGAEGREVVFGLDGALVGAHALPAGEPVAKTLEPLGRVFVAIRDGRAAGFVVEGEARGYKNFIRFFVALRGDFEVAGVRVIQHEEDPGLGAEVATGWFDGQYVGRSAEEVARLEVTRDPMPEDWRAALVALSRRAPGSGAVHDSLLARERGKPIYAVTGATISSRAVTDGVRVTVEHFRRRWALLAPHLGGMA